MQRRRRDISLASNTNLLFLINVCALVSIAGNGDQLEFCDGGFAEPDDLAKPSGAIRTRRNSLVRSSLQIVVRKNSEIVGGFFNVASDGQQGSQAGQASDWEKVARRVTLSLYSCTSGKKRDRFPWGVA
jgi:hypothetical protein